MLASLLTMVLVKAKLREGSSFGGMAFHIVSVSQHLSVVSSVQYTVPLISSSHRKILNCILFAASAYCEIQV